VDISLSSLVLILGALVGGILALGGIVLAIALARSRGRKAS